MEGPDPYHGGAPGYAPCLHTPLPGYHPPPAAPLSGTSRHGTARLSGVSAGIPGLLPFSEIQSILNSATTRILGHLPDPSLINPSLRQNVNSGPGLGAELRKLVQNWEKCEKVLN